MHSVLLEEYNLDPTQFIHTHDRHARFNESIVHALCFHLHTSSFYAGAAWESSEHSAATEMACHSDPHHNGPGVVAYPLSNQQRRRLLLGVVVVVVVDVLVDVVQLLFAGPSAAKPDPTAATSVRRGGGRRGVEQRPSLQPGHHLRHGPRVVRLPVAVLGVVRGHLAPALVLQPRG